MSALAKDIGLAHYAACAPRCPAVIEQDGRVWSRGRLDGLANRLARALRARGLRGGDALAIVSPNCAEFLVAYFAGIRLGLYVVPVNWHLSAEELGFVLRASAARAVIAHARLGRVLDAVRDETNTALRISIGRVPGYLPLAEVVDGFAATPLARGHEPGRVMPFTSATTGQPKAVVLPRHNASRALARIVAWHRSLGIELEADNVHLCASMLYHSAPLEGAVTALHMGHRVVLASRWRAVTLLELIERFRVTTSFMVPTMFVRLLKLPEGTRARYDLASLRFVVHGGAPCPPRVKRRMLDWWGPVIWESYGAAEGQGTIVSSKEWLRRPGTVGRPIPGSAVRIRDAQGRDCKPGEPGRVWLRPHTGDRFAYRHDPAGTELAVDGDFITVGDIGHVDDDGYLYLHEREADLILVSGMNVYPAEIEAVLVEHPAVQDCAVVGVANTVLGEVPVAAVQPARGLHADQRLTAALLDALASRIAPMKLPRRIVYLPALPRDPNGKLHRRRLRERLARDARGSC